MVAFVVSSKVPLKILGSLVNIYTLFYSSLKLYNMIHRMWYLSAARYLIFTPVLEIPEASS